MTTPTYQVTVVERGNRVDYHLGPLLLAAALPPRPHDAWFQYRAMDCEGRAVEVNTRDAAMQRAKAYADKIAAKQQRMAYVAEAVLAS